MSIKSELKTIGPHDKLIIVCNRTSKYDAWMMCKKIEAYLSSGTCRVIAMNNVDAYVIKDGEVVFRNPAYIHGGIDCE